MALPNCVAIDTETTGLNPWRGDHMFAAAAAFPNGRRLFWRGTQFEGLREICKDVSVDKVFHNADFDVRMLEKEGIEVKGQVWDTMIFCHLLDGRDALKNGLRLETMVQKYLPAQYRKRVKEVKAAMEIITGGKVAKTDKKYDFSKLPHDMLKDRVIADADITLRLFSKMYKPVSDTFPFLLEQEHKLRPVTTKIVERDH